MICSQTEEISFLTELLGSKTVWLFRCVFLLIPSKLSKLATTIAIHLKKVEVFLVGKIRPLLKNMKELNQKYMWVELDNYVSLTN